MKKMRKFLALSMTAGLLLGACADPDEVEEEEFPGMEEDMNGGVEDDGLDDSMEDDVE